jgi:Pyruvate/2-oxoacid:ferredoxin oxidoreductase delta subunit
MKRIEVNYALCNGCSLCENTCSLKKEGTVLTLSSSNPGG